MPSLQHSSLFFYFQQGFSEGDKQQTKNFKSREIKSSTIRSVARQKLCGNGSLKVLTRPSVITTWVGVTIRAVCITAGVQVNSDSQVFSCYPSVTAATKKQMIS